MTKTRFRSLLRRAGLTQRQAAIDLGIAQSTIVRWSEERVPPCAAAYAILMERLDAAGQEAVRAELAP